MSKILLLEDDLSLNNGLSFVFKKQGFELSIARTLKEAEGILSRLPWIVQSSVYTVRRTVHVL